VNAEKPVPHARPGPHATPQPPQLLVSLFVSTHALAQHATAHACPVCHWPEGLHVCSVVPLQVFCPGAHWPAQPPFTHVWFVHPTEAPH
jgi:hypothetical protein